MKSESSHYIKLIISWLIDHIKHINSMYKHSENGHSNVFMNIYVFIPKQFWFCLMMGICEWLFSYIDIEFKKAIPAHLNITVIKILSRFDSLSSYGSSRLIVCNETSMPSELLIGYKRYGCSSLLFLILNCEFPGIFPLNPSITYLYWSRSFVV